VLQSGARRGETKRGEAVRAAVEARASAGRRAVS
jgi:hypothetical protein